MNIKCPRCGKPTVYSPENSYRPFCSQRCKEADLFDWLVDAEQDETPAPKLDEDAPEGLDFFSEMNQLGFLEKH